MKKPHNIQILSHLAEVTMTLSKTLEDFLDLLECQSQLPLIGAIEKRINDIMLTHAVIGIMISTHT